MAAVGSQSKEECCKYMLIGFIYDVMRFEKQEETRQARYSDIQAKAYIFRVMLQGVWPAAYSRVLRVQRVFVRVMFYACNRTCESCFYFVIEPASHVFTSVIGSARVRSYRKRVCIITGHIFADTDEDLWYLNICEGIEQKVSSYG